MVLPLAEAEQLPVFDVTVQTVPVVYAAFVVQPPLAAWPGEQIVLQLLLYV